MKVYGMAISSVTQKVLLVFAEKGHECELVNVDVLKGEDKLPAHLARQPFGEIPVLEDDGFWLYESRAIIRYLDRRLSGPVLIPTDLRELARMDQWISIEQSYFSGPVWELVRGGPVYEIIRQSVGAANFPPPPDAASLDRARLEAAKPLDVMNEALSERDYLAGSQFSLAEVSFMPYVQYMVASGGEALILERPHVAAWWQRISTRPSWLKVGKVLDKSYL